MKKASLIVLMSILYCGVVSASSINGDYKGNPIVTVKSGSQAIQVDDVPAMIYDGRTMVPIAMLQQLGATVSWNGDTYTVDVKMPAVVTDNTWMKANEISSYYDRVGTVEVYDSSGSNLGQGSCVLINEQGLIVTNYHVAGQAAKLEVKVNKKTYTLNASDYVFSDSKLDLYGIYLDKNNKKGFPTLKINYSMPNISEKVFTMASPKGLEGTITTGEVTALRNLNEYQLAIQINAQLDNGASGGALFNNNGELIGILSENYDKTKLGFAIPMNTVKTLMSK